MLGGGLEMLFHVIPEFNSLDAISGCWLLLEIVGVTSLCKFLCQFQQFKRLQYLNNLGHMFVELSIKFEDFDFWQVIYYQIVHQILCFFLHKKNVNLFNLSAINIISIELAQASTMYGISFVKKCTCFQEP